MFRVAMCSAASARVTLDEIVSRSRRVMPWATFTLCGSPPAATRFTMSRSVTMPASFLPSSTTTDEIPFVRMSFATSANVSSASADFTSVCMMSATCIGSLLAGVSVGVASLPQRPHPSTHGLMVRTMESDSPNIRKSEE